MCPRGSAIEIQQLTIDLFESLENLLARPDGFGTHARRWRCRSSRRGAATVGTPLLPLMHPRGDGMGRFAMCLPLAAGGDRRVAHELKGWGCGCQRCKSGWDEAACSRSSSLGRNRARCPARISSPRSFRANGGSQRVCNKRGRATRRWVGRHGRVWEGNARQYGWSCPVCDTSACAGMGCVTLTAQARLTQGHQCAQHTLHLRHHHRLLGVVVEVRAPCCPWVEHRRQGQCRAPAKEDAPEPASSRSCPLAGPSASQAPCC